MADNNNNKGSMCFGFVEFVTNGVRQCLGLGAAAPAGTSDDAKPLIHREEEEEAVSVSIPAENSTATDYYPPVIADQEAPAPENNEAPPAQPPIVRVYAAPPPRLQTVSKGSGPKTN